MDNKMIENSYMSLSCDAVGFEVTDKLSGVKTPIDWASIQLQCDGRTFTPVRVKVEPQRDSYIIKAVMTGEEITLSGRLMLQADRHWCEFSFTLTNNGEELPTPKLLQVAASSSGAFYPVGYKHRNAYQRDHNGRINSQAGEEASGGRIPGCGYPIFSENIFVGLEHVAAYTLVAEQGFRCEYYPVWQADGTISAPTLIIGHKGNFPSISKSFLDYINQISIPRQPKPILCCCTFWSDPYLGNNEYRVSVAHYQHYIAQFLEAGLKPDMLMLDAGWNERNSIFQAKAAIGGDDGLKTISDFLASQGIDFALWSSINGNMGVSWEWAKSQGYPTGTGIGAAYSAPHQFVVLPDNDFAEKIAERHVELLQRTNCKFFKIDWDCECATNPDFEEKYPTEDHIRTASIEVINRIHAAIMEANPQCLLRNGWWPSPWWLKDVTFTWLAHSGDCEYAALPSLTQRDRAVTHRDAVYYYIFKQDQTPLPFDALDNHELAKAFRNPFADTPSSWCNAIIMLYLRGTVYQSVMINAATLTDEQAEMFRAVRSFAEQYSHILFNSSAQFIGGNPAAGEVYGFLHQDANSAIAVIRNPAVKPQDFIAAELCREIDFEIKNSMIIYPYVADIDPLQEQSLLGHQLILLHFSRHEQTLPQELGKLPFNVGRDGKCYLAAGLEPDDSFGTIQEDFVMLRNPAVELLGATTEDKTERFFLRIEVPDRMQDSHILFELSGAPEAELDKIPLRVYHDRYPETGNGHAMAVTRIYAKTREGCGVICNSSSAIADFPLQYRRADVPSGGESFLNIELERIDNLHEYQLKLYLCGRRGRSRRGKSFDLPEIIQYVPRDTAADGVGEYVTLTLK